MKGLLLKDFYTIFKQAKFFLILILVISVIPGLNMAALAIPCASFLPIMALAYDERSKWDTLAAMMPYSRRQLALSKYVLGYCTVAAAALLVFITRTLLAAVRHQAVAAEEWMALAVLICVAVIVQSLVMPILFKVGTEKGRLAYAALISVVGMSGLFWGDIPASVLAAAPELHPSIAILWALPLAVVINVLSMAVSARIYRTKEA